MLALFRDKGVISGAPSEECVLGGVGYFPGRACQEFYKPAGRSYEFWKMRPCGVEPRVGRDFNYWALGPSFEGSKCPACGAEFAPDDKQLWPRLMDAIVQSVRETGSAIVRSLECERDVPVAEWQCNPPHGIGNLAFTFWQWPPLDSPNWRIDIPGLVRGDRPHNHPHVWPLLIRRRASPFADALRWTA